MANFIDKMFTIIADIRFKVMANILLKLILAIQQEQKKQAVSCHRAGVSAQSRGKYAEALENYYEAFQVEEDPYDGSDILYNIGLIYGNIAFQVEEDLYDRSDTLYNIGLIYGNIGNYTQALRFYHLALALNSNLPQALNNIAVIYSLQAISARNSIILDDNENKDEYYFELSEELLDKAAEYWQEALILGPDSYILYNIGLMCKKVGKYTQALQFYRQALALNANFPQALNDIAVIYHSQAITFRNYIILDDIVLPYQPNQNNAEYYFELSKELFDRAAEYWQQALILAPDNYPEARNWLMETGRLK